MYGLGQCSPRYNPHLPLPEVSHLVVEVAADRLLGLGEPLAPLLVAVAEQPVVGSIHSRPRNSGSLRRQRN